MGAYINPQRESKEEFLEREGFRVASVKWEDVQKGELPVCLVGNSGFTAAAIAYSERELEEFSNPLDTRPKKWYIVSKPLLHKVCPELQSYIDRGERLGR